MNESTAPAASDLPADRNFALSLRVLTLIVGVALTASLALLIYRLLPSFPHGDQEPLAATPAPPVVTPAPAAVPAGRGDEVLMAPGRVFKCEEQGRTTFSDQACTGGAPDSGAAHGRAAAPVAPAAPAAGH